jgi:ribosomal protein S18 acetylase RimI-like enzyme
MENIGYEFCGVAPGAGQPWRPIDLGDLGSRALGWHSRAPGASRESQPASNEFTAMTSFTIRPYAPEDADWVFQCEIQLQEHELAIADPRIPQTRLPALPATHDYMKLVWESIEKNQGLMLIGEIGGQRRGLVAGHVVHAPWPMETWDSSHYGYVSDIFVEPQARGTGLAQALIDALAAHLQAADPRLTRLRINVLAANEIARSAYEKAGFVPYEVMYERPLAGGRK